MYIVGIGYWVLGIGQRMDGFSNRTTCSNAHAAWTAPVPEKKK